MDNSGAGSKSPNTSLSFRYNANNEELEELYDVCEDDPPTPQFDVSPGVRSENASPKRGEKSSSILDKYFKSMRTEKLDDIKPVETKVIDESRSSPKEVSLSPMKEYLNRLGKRNTSEVLTEVKEGSNETWKIFHDFKFKITQAVEDMKTRSLEETKEKSVPRENSVSDSEENSVIKDSDQSVGDTDNQVSSLDSSMQNLSEMTQPITAKATERDTSLPDDGKQNSDDSEDTHKNLVHSYAAEETRNCKDSPLEVESGVEALEDGIDGFGDMSKVEDCTHTCKPDTPTHCPPLNCVNKSNPERKPKNYFLNFRTYFLTFLLFVNYVLFPNCNIWNGFLLGIWFFCFASNLKQWVLDTYFSDGEPFSRSFIQLNRSSAMPVYTIPSVKEHRPLKKHEGWINHYRYPDYDPFTYHVNKTTTAFMKLEGCNLRISYTTTKIGKRALWDEKIEQVVFYQHRLYNLTGARLILLPKGLVRRRQWSKKYPICIILNEKETIQVLEKENADKKAADGVADKRKENLQEMESTETNTSPEKKRKFVWRRREKSISHSESEAGKEGLRHRLVRKMHRDKKPDTVPTCPDPAETAQQDDVVFHDAETELGPRGLARDDDDDLDEDLARIKDFLEDAELEGGAEGASAAECEWSLHVKQSRDKHSRLFLFGRTGRDKHEWYRRLSIAISEASAAADDSPTEERSGSEREVRDSIEMAVYKIAEKETVAFARSTTKGTDSISEAVTVTVPSQTLPHDSMSYEKTFWPYFLKIMQPKSSSSSCECRALPAELSWVNTVLARVVFDVMRDPALLARVQRRIQKKLNTLKLPSFMSPLLVTELSLSGACPLVERVSAPAWDERGVWLDADLRYEGGAYITILTQINLMKLKEKNVSLDENMMNTTDQTDDSEPSAKEAKVVLGERHLRKCKPAIYDSEVEDSAESSSDDESPPLQPVDSDEGAPPPVDTTGVADAPAASSKKKFLRIVDRIATNKYFQTVTDYKYVKRAMEGLSNTDIKLQVEVHGLEGRLAINLPPPPHDRLWIGFRTNPQLVLKARPAVGARSVRIAHVTNWIEAKLTKEFEKVLVLPNMEDIAIDVMTPTPIQFE